MRRVAALLLVFLLPACTLFTPVAPETPRERLVLAETSLAGAYNSLFAAYADGIVKLDTIKAMQPAIRSAEAAKEAAHLALMTGDDFTFEDRLTVLNEMTRQINAEIRRRYQEEKKE